MKLYKELGVNASRVVIATAIFNGLTEAALALDPTKEKLFIQPHLTDDNQREDHDDYQVTVTITLPRVWFNDYQCGRSIARVRIIKDCQLGISLYGERPRHPHADSNGFCWSNGITVTNYIKDTNYHMAIVTLLSVTNTFIPSDSYHTPEGIIICNRDGCDNDGTNFDPKIDGLEERAAHYDEYVCDKHCHSCCILGCDGDGDRRSAQHVFCEDHWWYQCPTCQLEHLPIPQLTIRVHHKPSPSLDYDAGKHVEVLGCDVCKPRCGDCSTVGSVGDMYMKSMNSILEKIEIPICYSCYRRSTHRDVSHYLDITSPTRTLLCRNIRVVHRTEKIIEEPPRISTIRIQPQERTFDTAVLELIESASNRSISWGEP